MRGVFLNGGVGRRGGGGNVVIVRHGFHGVATEMIPFFIFLRTQLAWRACTTTIT